MTQVMGVRAARWISSLVVCGLASVAVHIFGMTLAPAALADTAEAAGCSIRAGYEEWRPYQFTDPDGRPSGIDMDVVRAVAERTGCRVRFVLASLKRLHHDLRAGDVDVLFAYFKEERTTYGNYTRPYRDDTKALYVRRGLEGGVRDLQGFLEAGHRLGVVRGVFYGDAARRLIDTPAFKAQVERVVENSLNMKKILAGRLDGILVNPPLVADFLRANNATGRLERRSLIYETQMHMVFSKASVKPDVVARFDRAIKALRQDGTIDKIVARYLE